jgi:hypothetical protein
VGDSPMICWLFCFLCHDATDLRSPLVLAGEFKPFTVKLTVIGQARMNPVPGWRHSFQTLGFAFTIIGAILAMIGFIALNTPMNCPASGCMYNPLFAISASSFPAGLTLIIAGIVVIWVVKVESGREDRGSS